MSEAQNAVNPDGFTSILTKLQQKILVSKSDSSLNALARVGAQVEVAPQKAVEYIGAAYADIII